MKKNNAAGPVTGGYRWAILALLTAAQLAMSVAAYSWGPLAPFLKDEFQVTRGQVGSLVSALFLASAVVSIPSGLAVDRWGSRVMLVIALAVMGFTFASLYLASVFPALFFIAALSGIGYGMINQVSTKGIMIWFPSEGRAMAMGIKQTGVTLGGALGAVMLPAISLAFGWRWAAVSAGALILAMVAVVLPGYRDYPPEMRASGRPRPGRNSLSRIRELGGPGIRRELLIVSLAGTLLAFSQTSITSFLVLYLQEDLNFSLWAAGACLTVLMAAGTAGRVGWGVISDRFFRGDRQRPMIVLCLMAFAAALGAALISSGSPAWLAYFLSAVLGFTFMGWNAVLLTLCAEIAGPELAGSVTGLMITAVSVGVVAGPPVFGIIADKTGYFWGWLLLALAGIAGACSFIYSVRRRRETG